jgi:hypothetical protein
MTITDLKNQGLLLFECISGNRAYGTNTPQSDTDLKGVFVLLLKIRSGIYSYEELMAKAEHLMDAVETAYGSTILPEKPDKARISALTTQIRYEFYAQK